MRKLVQKKTSLWFLGVGPLIWSIHFLFTYVYAAVWCAKVVGRGGELGPVRTSVFVATAMSLLIVGLEMYVGWKKNTHKNGKPPHNEPTPDDRERFLGLARLLISGLSFIAIIYTAYVAWFFRSCI